MTIQNDNGRRRFIKKSAMGVAGLALADNVLTSCMMKTSNKITFGVISDVHEDLQEDATQRLQDFVDAATQHKPDFIIQLGDLCHGTGADKILSVWNSFVGEKYNVLGNHDMDHNSKQEMVKRYEMSNSYYHFDKKGLRFIVLDCNFTRKDGKLIDYDNGNYYVAREDRGLINDEQLQWLKSTIADSKLPCVIFSHQAFDEIGGSVPNREDIRNIIKEANSSEKRVIACLCGHHHIDAHSKIDGVDYLQINSASYLWVEGEKKFSKGNMAEYQDSVYAFVTIDLDNKTIETKGVHSQFKAPAPTVEDFTAEVFKTVNAGMKDRTLRF
ncbi:MAG: metallophosphoesterase family protein [Bacteroidales bacterium]